MWNSLFFHFFHDIIDMLKDLIKFFVVNRLSSYLNPLVDRYKMREVKNPVFFPQLLRSPEYMHTQNLCHWFLPHVPPSGQMPACQAALRTLLCAPACAFCKLRNAFDILDCLLVVNRLTIHLFFLVFLFCPGFCCISSCSFLPYKLSALVNVFVRRSEDCIAGSYLADSDNISLAKLCAWKNDSCII